LGGDGCRETVSEGCREIITSAVFECEDRGSEHAIVLAPRHRRALRRGGVDTDEARLAIVFNRDAAAGARAARSRYDE
jgi:hypothetical protein